MTIIQHRHIPLFAHVFAPILAMLPSPYFPSSSGLLLPLRDGTDPLLGGHGAEHGDHHTRSCSVRGGRS